MNGLNGGTLEKKKTAYRQWLVYVERRQGRKHPRDVVVA